MKNIRQFIKDTLVEMHKTVSTDKYGQVHVNYLVPSLFGDKANEVEKFCNDNQGILRYSTYGYTYGTYRAFTIEDKDIRMACSKALSQNPSYINAMTSW